MTDIKNTLTTEVYNTLFAMHGPILGGADLRQALGYRNAAAMRQARYRGQITLTLFTLPHRRGHYALTTEVAQWLVKARIELADPEGPSAGVQESASVDASVK